MTAIRLVASAFLAALFAMPVGANAQDNPTFGEVAVGTLARNTRSPTFGEVGVNTLVPDGSRRALREGWYYSPYSGFFYIGSDGRVR
jgi:hypothetical protein